MFTTGSKYFFAASALGVIATLGYAFGTDNEPLGMVLLLTWACAFGFMGIVILAFRSVTSAAYVPYQQAYTGEVSDLPRLPVVSPAIWPLLGAAAVAVTLIGLVAEPAVFVIGLFFVAAVIVEWMIHAWADRASDDPAYNARVRGRLMHPLEFPILGALLVGIVVSAFSRIMLTVDKMAAVWAFVVLASVVLVIGIILAAAPRVAKGIIWALVAIGGFGLLAAGTAAAISGEREIEHHGTEGLSAEGEKAINEVADKSAVAAEIRIEGNTFSITELELPRATQLSLLFVNNDNVEHNLVVQTGEENGEPVFVRTDFVEEGNTAFLTVRFPNPGVFPFFSEGGPVSVKGTITVP